MRLSFLIPLLLPLPAAAFTAQNGMRATQISPTEIAVAYEARGSDTDYWCAAADFAQQVLGQPGNTRIWRASPKPRKSGEGLTFTLDPARKAEGAGMSQFGSGQRDGSQSLSMVVASFCQPNLLYWRN